MATLNISCTVDQCPMCKTSDKLSDKRSSLSCVGCDTVFHKKCARNLKKLSNGAFVICCDDSLDRSILSPPPDIDNDDDDDLDIDSLPDSLQISKCQLNKIIQKAATEAARETVKSFSSSIEIINKRFINLDSKASQLEKTYKDLAEKNPRS